MEKKVFLRFLGLTVLLVGVATFFSCKPERGSMIDGYIEAFFLGHDKETHGCMWDLSTFPFYRMENEEWWDVFDNSSVTVLNNGQALSSHLTRYKDWDDTAVDVYDSVWLGWDALPEEVDFDDKSLIAVSLKETWDAPVYSGYMRGEEGSYDLFLVTYRYPGDVPLSWSDNTCHRWLQDGAFRSGCLSDTLDTNRRRNPVAFQDGGR